MSGDRDGDGKKKKKKKKRILDHSSLSFFSFSLAWRFPLCVLRGSFTAVTVHMLSGKHERDEDPLSPSSTTTEPPVAGGVFCVDGPGSAQDVSVCEAVRARIRLNSSAEC
ncbi:hypothetical protein F2P81_004287 [Scophthalmus maximus]|uniref:Uncharacterized protein n=1 Tax=Scophthalmus maximus TaxID=52904 RepID=A0A6A4TGP9_SCOMX|nr:hypothetical protein F2P81_004287 [Scophthalmus maximus]